MSGGQAGMDQAALRERFEELEHRKGELTDELREAERAVNRREVKLVHWERAEVREEHERRLLVKLVVLTVVAALVGGAALMFFKNLPGRNVRAPVEVVYRTRTPRLMVSSSPSPAQVIIDGKTVGQTPLVRLLPTGTRYTVEVRAAGYSVWRKTFLSGKTGRHVHAVLGLPDKASP